MYIQYTDEIKNFQTEKNLINYHHSENYIIKCNKTSFMRLQCWMMVSTKFIILTEYFKKITFDIQQNQIKRIIL